MFDKQLLISLFQRRSGRATAFFTLSLIVGLLVFGLFGIFTRVQAADSEPNPAPMNTDQEGTDEDSAADPDVTVQRVEVDEAIEPGDRISWPAVFGGGILAIVIQMALNFLGISLGM